MDSGCKSYLEKGGGDVQHRLTQIVHGRQHQVVGQFHILAVLYEGIQILPCLFPGIPAGQQSINVASYSMQAYGCVPAGPDSLVLIF